MLKAIIQKIKTAPKDPGVYIFYQGKLPLYIGKASNLKNRLKNYLQVSDLKTETLHREADELKLIKLRSNIEALIVESRLIKSLKPKLNILWRDDKSYFYVYFTKEQFPRIYIGHQNTKSPNSSFIIPDSNRIGPFTDGQSIKAILRLLRKFFPYCSCFRPHFRLCLNAQIGNCPGYCCNQNLKATKIQSAGYQKNIRKIKNILTGKDKKFIRQLKDPYELLVLEKIWKHQPYLNEIPNSKLRNSKNENGWDFQKVECYDNSHLSGKEAVGAMTAWVKQDDVWIADKNMWRKFRIRGNYTEDDPRMMEEVVRRRLNHPEWPYPDLTIIDGGITQLKAAKVALSKSQITNPKLQIIAFAKPHKLVYGIKAKPVAIESLPEELQKIILLAIDRTHHYAQNYHRQIRQRKLLNL